jgi:hypothetical protein
MYAPVCRFGGGLLLTRFVQAADQMRRDQDALRRQQEELARQRETFEREQRNFQQRQQQQQQQQQQQRSTSAQAGTSWSPQYDNMGISAQRMDDAQKHAKFAVSALQFEDTTTAIKELKIALQLLEG